MTCSAAKNILFCCTLETTPWSKCFRSTQPVLWYCCTMKTTSWSNVYIALTLCCGIVVLWKLLLEVNVSIVLNLSCGIVVIWKLLLVVDFSIALNLSIASYHKCVAVPTGTLETISWGKCFYSTQPELRYCCTMEATSFWSRSFHSSQPEYYEFISLVCWVTHKGSVLSHLWAVVRTGRMSFQPRFERYLGR